MNTNKIAFITGANKGIGLETARQLGQHGFHILLGARSAEKGLEAVKQLEGEGISAEFIQIDVSDSQSIATAATEIESKFNHLDVLINNAGVNLDSPDNAMDNLPMGSFRDTFETNLFGLIDTTQRLIPLLKKAPAARIVNLSSILSSNTLHLDPTSPIYDFKWPAYDVSKSAVNAYTVHLAYALKETPIKVNAAHPGWVKTDMGGDEAPMEIADGAKTSVQLATLDDSGPSGGLFHMGEALPW